MVKHLIFPRSTPGKNKKKAPSSVAWPVSSTHGRVHLAPFLGGGTILGQKPWENDEKMMGKW